MSLPLRTSLALLAAALALPAQDDRAANAIAPTAKTSTALPLYRTAATELRRAFDAGPDDPIELPDDEPTATPFADPRWREATAKAASALAVFATAARAEHAPSGRGADPMFTAYDDCAFDLWQAARLVAAHGHQRIAATTLVEAAYDAATLLRHAGHLRIEQSARAASLATQTEILAATLLQHLARVDDPAADVAETRARCAQDLTAHLRGRIGPAAIAAQVEAEALRIVDATLASAATGPLPSTADASEVALRERAAAIRARFAALVTEYLAPARDDASTAAAVDSALTAAAARLRAAARRPTPRELAAMTPAAVVDRLAAMFAAMALPDLQRMLAEDREALALLRAAAEALAPKPNAGR